MICKLLIKPLNIDHEKDSRQLLYFCYQVPVIAMIIIIVIKIIINVVAIKVVVIMINIIVTVVIIDNIHYIWCRESIFNNYYVIVIWIVF